LSDGPGTHDERLAPLIDAALHRYFSRLTRRYVPIIGGLAVLILVVYVLPSKHQAANTNVAAGRANAATGGRTTGAAAATGTANNSSDGGATGAQGGTGAAGASGAASASDGGQTVAGASQTGTARSGVPCGLGVLQVSWSPYAPPCVAAYSGGNGGATGQGVTDSTITLVMRHTPDQDAFGASVGFAPFSDLFADAQVLVDFFNQNYETYGRTVVLKELAGQGQALAEQADQGQAGAQADAQREKDMGAFADITGVGAVVYGAALADRGIIMMGTPYTPESVYEQYAPYVHGTPFWPTGEHWGHATAAAVCQRMAGMPAVFAGDPVYQKTTRVFGMTSIEQPSFAAGGNIFEQDVNRCGVQLAKRADYNYNYTNEAQQAVAIVTQMKAAGVTTLVHAGDPLMYAQLTLAASQQNWHPEFIGVDPTAAAARIGDQEEMAHAMSVGPLGRTPGDSGDEETGRVFRIASGGAAPRSAGTGNLVQIYMNLLEVVGAIQAAGPNLNANTFQAGFGSLPDAAGEFGLWRGAQLYNVTADYVIARWDPSKTNAGDGKAGDFIPCDNGTRYPFDNPQMGAGQLGC
jgi:hypothetical protein